MKIDDIKGPITETLDSRADLDWAQEDEETFVTRFAIEDRAYGIIVRIEKADGSSIGRVDFTADGSLVATDLHKDQFAVLGIVKNGVIERFGDCDGFYFVAKKGADPEHYSSRKKLYGRLRSWLSAERNLLSRSEERPDETIFYLAQNKEVMALMAGEANEAR